MPFFETPEEELRRVEGRIGKLSDQVNQLRQRERNTKTQGKKDSLNRVIAQYETRLASLNNQAAQLRSRL